MSVKKSEALQGRSMGSGERDGSCAAAPRGNQAGDHGAGDHGAGDGGASPCAGAARLTAAGLRPTRQRCLLHDLLFRSGDRHVTAEMLHAEAAHQGLSVSLATVYNTLHQFERAGLVRQIPVDSTRTFFDTNTTDHLHFLNVDNGTLTDGPRPLLQPGLTAPEGFAVDGIDVVVRVRRAPGLAEPRATDGPSSVDGLAGKKTP
ncbi:MAG: iron response transcriptional regulator IrrA [Alphaproteobacteria bacterium]